MNLYLVAAYSAVWVVLFIYLFMLNSRQDKLLKEMAALKKELES